MPTSSPASTQKFDISTAPPFYPQRQPGSKASKRATTSHGPLSTSRMSIIFLPSRRKLKKGICATNAKEYVPPKNLTLLLISIDRENIIELPPIEKRKNIYITTYNPRETIFSNQTLKLLHTSIKGNNYQMIVYKIDGNSTWIDPMKNRTEGEMILSRRRALIRMKLQGIVPKH